MAELLRLQTRLIGMSGHTAVEEVAGELAKWLASKGVSFAITLGKVGLEALEFVGRELMQGIVPGDSNLPTFTVYFPTHLYSIRVLEQDVNRPGEWRVTDRNLKSHNCDMNWRHCGLMARYGPERGVHNYVPDLCAFAPYGKFIVGDLVSNEGEGAGFVRVKGDYSFPPDIQDRACLFWSEKMQGWMNRGLTMPPPSGPLPYTLAGLPGSSSNTMNVVKPQLLTFRLTPINRN